MDSNLLAVIISVAIAAAGGVYAVVMWRRKPEADASAARRQPPRSEKQAVYQQLWNKIETLHVLVRRSEDLPAAEFRAHLAEVDSFINQQSPVVDRQDSELARRYLDALRAFRDQIDPPGEVGKGENVQETRRLPPELYTRAIEMTETAKAVERLRGELLARFHIIINANT